MTEKTNTFLKEDEKKHSVRYICEQPNAIAGIIYFSRRFLGDSPPDEIEVTAKFEGQVHITLKEGEMT